MEGGRFGRGGLVRYEKLLYNLPRKKAGKNPRKPRRLVRQVHTSGVQGDISRCSETVEEAPEPGEAQEGKKGEVVVWDWGGSLYGEICARRVVFEKYSVATGEGSETTTGG